MPAVQVVAAAGERALARGDREAGHDHRAHARAARAVQHLREVGLERSVRQVRTDVDHRRRSFDHEATSNARGNSLATRSARASASHARSAARSARTSISIFGFSFTFGFSLGGATSRRPFGSAERRRAGRAHRRTECGSAGARFERASLDG
jgi:hypothetical protein